MTAKVCSVGNRMEDSADRNQNVMEKSRKFAARFYSRFNESSQGMRFAQVRGPFIQGEGQNQGPQEGQEQAIAFPQQVHDDPEVQVAQFLQAGANVIDESGDEDDVPHVIGNELQEVAKSIEDIVNEKAEQRLDYNLYIGTVREAVERLRLSTRGLLWTMYEIGARFYQREQGEERGRGDDNAGDDSAILEWPGQAIHEYNLQNKPDVEELLKN